MSLCRMLIPAERRLNCDENVFAVGQCKRGILGSSQQRRQHELILLLDFACSVCMHIILSSCWKYLIQLAMIGSVVHVDL